MVSVTDPSVLAAGAIVAEARRKPFGREQAWFELLNEATVPTLCSALAQMWGPGEEEYDPEHFRPYRESVLAMIQTKLTTDQVRTMTALSKSASRLTKVSIWIAIVGTIAALVSTVRLFF